MVVVISAHLPTEHSLFHAHVPLSATEVLLSQDRACGTVYRLLQDRSPATDSLGNVWKHIYSGPRNRSALWLLITVRYANTLTYLLAFLQPAVRPAAKCQLAFNVRRMLTGAWHMKASCTRASSLHWSTYSLSVQVSWVQFTCFEHSRWDSSAPAIVWDTTRPIRRSGGVRLRTTKQWRQSLQRYRHASVWLVLICSLAVVGPRVGHTIDVLSPFRFDRSA